MSPNLSNSPNIHTGCIRKPPFYSNSGAKESSYPGYRDCRPKQKVGFLKTHKCASTSIQNILMRYGLAHKLNFVLPLRGNYLGRTATFTRAMLFDTPWEEAGMEYHMFALHTKWDSVQVGEVLGDRGDVAYVSMLRDPVELFRSVWGKIIRHFYFILKLKF